MYTSIENEKQLQDTLAKNKAARIAPDDGSYGKVEITGKEANFLLSLLDDYLNNAGNISYVEGYTEEHLDSLRDRLFLAHEHPKE